MCGICGFTDKFKLNSGMEMMKTISHRGPDEDGYYFKKSIFLGHTRLSIIDLSTGKQPLCNEDKSIWVAFNGEIYNFPEIRKVLTKHKFKTKTDTEVIVHAYEEWGDNFLNHLNGMFAIALFDTKRERLILARDRVGKKPLYYHLYGNDIAWGSEIKSLLKLGIKTSLDFDSIDNFLTYQYIPQPGSIYNEIKKLPKGSYAIWTKKDFKIKNYWKLEPGRPQQKIELNEALDRVENLIINCVKRRLISDVPLGAFLSGGIDSSLIVAVMSRLQSKKVKTFSIKFKEESFDESSHAMRVSKLYNTDHHQFLVDYNLEEIIEDLLYYFDEPFADQSFIPTYFLSKMTRTKVTVALSGDGGDEIFGGYNRYIAHTLLLKNILPYWILKPIHSLINIFPEKAGYYGESFSKKVRLLLDYFIIAGKENFMGRLPIFSLKEKEKFYNPRMKGFNKYNPTGFIPKNTSLSDMMIYDINQWLVDDILVKVDRMSMAVALEVRSPFLDYEILDFMAGIQDNYKIRGTETKFLLKTIARKYLPDDIIFRKKHGFAIPKGIWFKNSLKGYLRNVLFNKGSKIKNFLNIKEIEKVFNMHVTGKKDESEKLWTLLILELWLKNNST